VSTSVYLRPCEECGLPLSICSALAAYRIAAKAFKRNDMASTIAHINLAEECEQEYRSAYTENEVVK
jgi:hypothetical protein